MHRSFLLTTYAQSHVTISHNALKQLCSQVLKMGSWYEIKIIRNQGFQKFC